MKKTMFITSVIMVIVLAVALTTSSLAWFSAGGQSTVTTDTLKIKALASTSDGIAISNLGGAQAVWKSKIELSDEGNTDLLPLVPYSKASTTSAELLRLALVGGQEAPMMSLTEFAADYELRLDVMPDPDNLEANIPNDSTTPVYESVYAQAVADGKIAYFGGDTVYITGESEYDANSNGINDQVEAMYNALLTNGYISQQDLRGSLETQLYYDRDAYMIGNKLDFNELYTNDAYRTGYYTDTFYIKNLAEGTNAQSIFLDTDISFWFDVLTEVKEGDTVVTNDQGVPLHTYRNEVYSRLNRGEKYDLDPTLCVAVLAKTGYFLTDVQIAELLYKKDLKAKYIALSQGENPFELNDNTPISELSTEDNPDTTEVDESHTYTYAELNASIAALEAGNAYDWEIIAYAESKGKPADKYIPTTLNMGLDAAKFAEGEASAASTATLSTEGLNKTNTTILRGERTVFYTDANNPDEKKSVTVAADELEIKVISWYDGTTLNNNNSNDGERPADYSRGSANLKFDLTFTDHAAAQQQQQNP